MTDTEDYSKVAPPTAHKTSHEFAGDDEIDVGGLEGELSDAQPSEWDMVSGKPTTFPPDSTLAHKASHQDTGTDEISVASLSGELTDEQKSNWAKVSGKPSTFSPSAHKDSHKDGGTDELNVTGLVGTTPRALLGDATPGRVLRVSLLTIENGIVGVSLRVELINIWNGDALAVVHSLIKGETEGNFHCHIWGMTIRILAAGLSGTPLFVFPLLTENSTEVNLIMAAEIYSNDLQFSFQDQETGNFQDITSLVDTGDLAVTILYLTDA